MTKVADIDFNQEDLSNVKLETQLASLPYFEGHIVRRVFYKHGVSSVEDLLIHYKLHNSFRTYRLGERIDLKLRAFCHILLENPEMNQAVSEKVEQKKIEIETRSMRNRLSQRDINRQTDAPAGYDFSSKIKLFLPPGFEKS
jgi:hypothetical protein